LQKLPSYPRPTTNPSPHLIAISLLPSNGVTGPRSGTHVAHTTPFLSTKNNVPNSFQVSSAGEQRVIDTHDASNSSGTYQGSPLTDLKPLRYQFASHNDEVPSTFSDGAPHSDDFQLDPPILANLNHTQKRTASADSKTSPSTRAGTLCHKTQVISHLKTLQARATPLSIQH
jgi:hypothetical protein